MVDSRLDRAVEAMRAADACGGNAGGTVLHRGRALAHADVCSACAVLAVLAALRGVLADVSDLRALLASAEAEGSHAVGVRP